MGSITVTNLGKAYKQYPNRWARLAEWLLPGAKPCHSLKWVMQGISFSVQPGEAIGIIGINGAGKSTLLKMITGTTQPTTGDVHITGRVAALLELGMGFHPDFTGRQNVLMAGQLLGYSAAELHHSMAAIEAFAEIGDYLDQPVRVYSSGMQMRLAFSVATVHRPDVLIIDEALSVGDTYFQHKSFERIRSFGQQGTTLLIVSHDKSAIQSICDRAILLDGGHLAIQGRPEQVMDYYNALIAARENTRVEQKMAENGRVQTTSGTGEAVFLDISLLTEYGKHVEIVETGVKVTLRVTAQANTSIPCLIFGYMIKDRLGLPVFGSNTHHIDRPVHNLKSQEIVEYRLTFPANLGPGSYSVTVALTGSETHLGNNYEWRDLALLFTVVNSNKPVFLGSVWLDTTLTIHR